MSLSVWVAVAITVRRGKTRKSTSRGSPGVECSDDYNDDYSDEYSDEYSDDYSETTVMSIRRERRI